MPSRRASRPTGAGGGLLVWLVGPGILALYLGSELYLLSGRLGFPLDDSWIHLQFARQLAGGEGLAYNSGTLSTASTAPLWTALLSLGFLLPLNPLLWAKLLGSAFYLTSADAAARLAGELDLSAGWRWLAAGLTLATPWLVWAALSGMEIGLFTTLGLWGMVWHLRERRRGEPPLASLAVLGLACLARPEGYALLALALLDRFLRCELSAGGLRIAPPPVRSFVHGLLAVAVIAVPTWLFYRSVGGSFLPSTFAAKAAPPSSLVPSLVYLRTVVDVFFRSQPLMLLACGAGVLGLVERLGRRSDRGLLPVLWVFGLPLAFSLLAPEKGIMPVGNFGRYYFPLLPVVVVLGLVGIAVTIERCGNPRPSVRAALLIGLLLPQLWGLADGVGRYLRTIANVEDSDVAAARWLAGRLPPQALLAVQDVGAIKYLLPNPVLDLAGLVTPEIVPVLRGTGADEATYWEQRVLAFLGERRPDYLVVFPTSFPLLTRSPGFEKVQTFKVQDNLAMIGDELVVFSTPWTAHPLTEPRR